MRWRVGRVARINARLRAHPGQPRADSDRCAVEDLAHIESHRLVLRLKNERKATLRAV